MRGVPRWLAMLAIVAIAVLVCAFTVRRVLTPAAFLIEAAQTTLPADGFTSTEINVRSSTGRDLRGLHVNIDNPHHVVAESVTAKRDSAVISVRAGVQPGETRVTLSAPGFEPTKVNLRTSLDLTDSVGDGTPDFLRLHDAADRAAFRHWFTILAESRYYRQQNLAVEIGDCAALLRYAYREALRQHDATWARRVALPVAPSGDSIRQYQYPFTPLGAGLFRVREGRLAPDDISNGSFAQFADAKTLWRHNSYFVGRDISRARPGDLLFFRQDGHDLPFHAMIFLGISQIEPGGEVLVVYHTGPIGKSTGEIRRPSLSQLLNFPDPRWRPVPSNPSFLGVYRWNILRGTD